jgi:4-diphosphocytidyl-2-C-methyl-D-erythritol kinase
MRIQAPAKLNLCLYLGPRRDDGLHELCSLFEPLALADTIEISAGTPAAGGRGVDEVVCAGVKGDNLAAHALAALRKSGWQSPPLRVEIEKRIPVAAGLGGGSADAAAILRLAGDSGSDAPDLERIAAGLGADVPSQLSPALALVQGAGERVERLPAPASHAALLLPAGGRPAWTRP